MKASTHPAENSIINSSVSGLAESLLPPAGREPFSFVKTLRQGRATLARLLARVSPGSEWFGPARKICPSIRDWCAEHKCFFYELEQPGSFIAVLPQSRVYGRHDVAVISPTDEVFTELSLLQRSWRPALKIEDHRIFRQLRLPQIKKLKGVAAVLALPGAGTYYHWMFEALPRLELLRRAGFSLEDINHFVVNGTRQRFQRATLDQFKILSRSVSLEEFPQVKADTLLAPSFSGISGEPPAWILNFLRNSFLTGKALGFGETPKRIYISRARAKRRRVINEDEVMGILVQSGFQAVCLEQMTFAEQVALFQKAEAIAGLHGAGLTNLAFCSPGTRVLEIFAPGPKPQMYAHISRLLGLNYFGLVPASAAPGKTFDRWRDVEVAPAELEMALETFLAGRETLATANL